MELMNSVLLCIVMCSVFQSPHLCNPLNYLVLQSTHQYQAIFVYTFQPKTSIEPVTIES